MTDRARPALSAFVLASTLLATTAGASARPSRASLPPAKEKTVTATTIGSSTTGSTTTGSITSHPGSADVVRAFFAAFGQGDVDGVVATFHPAAEIVAVRAGTPGSGLYGTYEGTAGARRFVEAMGRILDTQAFTVDHVVGEGKVVFASGRFTHKLRSTGRLFSSDWALRCVVEDGRIRQYRFFEDSAAFVEASR